MEFSWWLYWEAAEAGGYWEHLQAGGREEAERAARATLLATERRPWELGFSWQRPRGRVTMPAIDPDLCAVIRCAYCGRFALDPPEAPPATDREAWEFLTEQHWPECPWVQTRAWSLSLRPGIHSRNGITYIQPEGEDN